MENKNVVIDFSVKERETDQVFSSSQVKAAKEDESLNLNKIPASVLRTVGAIIILIASAVYMFQGAGAPDVYHRHFIYLGITALFGVLTWFLGAVIKENKGARTFTALAITTVPVLFTQLASMIYTMLGKPDEGTGTHIVENSVLDFAQIDPMHFVGIIVATLAVTVPTILIGNRILARKQMLPLTILLMIGNALMLLPLRSALVPIGIILTLFTIAVLTYIMKAYKDDLTMRTKEGFIALLNIFVPIIIIATRTITLYQDGQHPGFIGLLLGLAGASMVVLPMRKKESKTATFFQAIGALTITAGWGVASGGFAFDTEILKYYVLAVPVTAIMSGISYTMKKSDGVVFRRLPAIVFAGTLISGQVLFESEFGAITAVLSLMGGAALIAFAAKNHEKTPFFLGGIAIASGVLGLGVEVVSALSDMNWILLLGTGVVIIVCSSLSEVFNKKWKGQLINFKDELTAWH